MCHQAIHLCSRALTDFYSLLKSRQIRNSRPCAIATAKLLRLVVAKQRFTDLNQLIERIQQVGQRLTAAQPREIAVGNIVRRVLGVIRDESEEDRKGDGSNGSEAASDSRPHTPRETFSPRAGVSSPLRNVNENSNELSFNPGGHGTDSFPRPPMLTSHASYVALTSAPLVNSMFSLLSHPVSTVGSPSATPGTQSPSTRGSPHPQSQSLASINATRDIKAEVVDGIDEIIDELDVVDDQIASYALEHIHSNEIILIHGSSTTVQKFLLKAASKRKFTVIHAEAYPNNHLETHAAVTGKPMGGSEAEDELSGERFSKPLIAAGITVVLISDAAVFALMSRVNKVILGTHVVLANGGLVAQAGSKTVAQAARAHRTPVMVVSGVYKLSPLYPFDFDALIEYGDSDAVLGYEDGYLAEKVDVENPLFDYVPAELVDLYITNL